MVDLKDKVDEAEKTLEEAGTRWGELGGLRKYVVGAAIVVLVVVVALVVF